MKKIYKTLLCLVMMACIMPVNTVSAKESKNEVKGVSIVYQNDKTQEEIDALLIEQTEKQLEESIPGYKESKLLRGRPTYTTEYGPTKKVSASGYAGNQLAGGYKFSTGSGFWYANYV